MNRFRCSVAVALIALMAFAHQHSPLPASLLSAKTMYVENNSGQTKIGENCSSELSKWGRFKLVNDPKEADVIFRVDAHLGNYGSGGSSGDDDANSKSAAGETAGFATVSVLDQKGQTLWSDTRRWGSLFNGSKSAIRDVVRQLRKRIEEQEQKK
jgi:hypothetical protein